MTDGPKLSAAQLEAVAYRGTALQIIACAGSGKTEAVSRRVAALLAEGAEPESIVAFTFTEKAGAELKERIYRRAGELLGGTSTERLSPMYVGTIHGWCFHTLQAFDPRFGNYEVIDEHRHAALLSREARALELKGLAGRHWDGIRAWIRIVDLVGDELLDRGALEAASLLGRWDTYLGLMDRYRLLTFGRLVVELIRLLEDPVAGARIRAPLRHLVVDEYQDVNPAQERLVSLLASDGASLCVVGDDDQAIYQWRGADVANIVGFGRRRPESHGVRLLENRRSRPGIVRAASDFASRIDGRLEKSMHAVRPDDGDALFAWSAPTDLEEAEILADTVVRLRAQGRRWSDMAVLLRSVRGAGGPIIAALNARHVPVSAGGRTGLFLVPELSALGETYAYLAGFQWRDGAFGAPRDPDLGAASATLHARFPARTVADIEGYVVDWRSFYTRLNTKPVDLVSDYYRFLDWLGIPRALGPGEDGDSGLLGSLARFSNLLADYEHMNRRGRYSGEGGKLVFEPGPDRGKAYWFGLGNYLLHYAFGAYEDFEGEPAIGADAVQVLTVHQAKGLEWPVVFLPSLVDGRFPSSRSGRAEESPFPESVFPAEKRERYAGTDADERRLFYTAMTRARDALYLSCFDRKSRAFAPSPYLLEVAGGTVPRPPDDLPLPEVPAGFVPPTAERVELSFSELATWEDCGNRWRLANSFGFENRLAEELGYGHAVHHVLRMIAERVANGGEAPDEREVAELVGREFYAPFANPGGHERMVASARRLVSRYLSEWRSDLDRIWAVERPFELHTEDGLVSGRADVVLDREGDADGTLAIVDYKTSATPELTARYEWQLRVYARAAELEGRAVGAAWLHDLSGDERSAVDIGEAALDAAVERARRALAAIRSGDCPPRPEARKCASCDYRRVCGRRDPAADDADE